MERIYIQAFTYVLSIISTIVLLFYMTQTSKWRYWVQALAWLINVIVFYTFVLGNFFGVLSTPVGISLMDWSALIRLQTVIALLSTLIFLTDWTKLWNLLHLK